MDRIFNSEEELRFHVQQAVEIFSRRTNRGEEEIRGQGEVLVLFLIFTLETFLLILFIKLVVCRAMC